MDHENVGFYSFPLLGQTGSLYNMHVLFPVTDIFYPTAAYACGTHSTLSLTRYVVQNQYTRSTSTVPYTVCSKVNNIILPGRRYSNPVPHSRPSEWIYFTYTHNHHCYYYYYYIYHHLSDGFLSIFVSHFPISERFLMSLHSLNILLYFYADFSSTHRAYSTHTYAQTNPYISMSKTAKKDREIKWNNEQKNTKIM